MQDTMDLVNNQDIDALEALYQAPHCKAWFKVDYGSNPKGIFTAACPHKALHALENGISQHLLKVLFKEILKPQRSAFLDQHVNRWNSYPRQHFMRSYNVEGYPRLV